MKESDMNRSKPIAAALTAGLLLIGAVPARALSSDQESACGAILCLLGGSGVTECAGYLERYFAIAARDPQELYDRRLEFLHQCPAPELPGDVRPLIVNYGAICQPAQLVAYLNQQIRWCETRNVDNTSDCQPSGDEWRLCASFYESGYTTYETPQLHKQCVEVPDTDGSLTERCTFVWTEAGVEPPADSLASQTGFVPTSGRAPMSSGQPSR
jgi:hypothetical protein